MFLQAKADEDLSFLVTLTNYLTKANKERKLYSGSQAKKSIVVETARLLVTLHPQSGSRGGWMLVVMAA